MNALTACTSILIGKNASADHSIIIGRTEDAKPAWPKHYVVHPAGELPTEFISKETGVTIPLPTPSFQYSATPEWTDEFGLFEEAGLNEFDVAMSATESAYSNEAVLAMDPYSDHGINEEAMVTITLPFVKTAREGVQRLGQLIAQYGTGESNGVLFADNDEAWYMEIGSGHLWVAQRIPDDAYAVVGNQLAIQTIKFDDPANFMYHPELLAKTTAAGLYQPGTPFNFRQIFGTRADKDAHYSTPRVWYGHRMFSASQVTEETPESQTLPFLMHPDQPLTLQDARDFLTSHYQATPFDPVGTGTEAQRHRYRPITLAKTQESHLIQTNRTGNNILWLAMGVGVESLFVPFFNGITDTPPAYQRGGLPASLDSAYWIYKLVGVLVERDRTAYWPQLVQLQTELNDYLAQSVADLDRQNLTPVELTQVNLDLANTALKHFEALAMELLVAQTDLSPFNYDTDANL
ncbi:Dipeptidase [Limosilactobacillus equigenerosi DSM 18793 = JCM 14505]|uniref:Dipeptidase n=2 Tax=Limosilactobacillus TaxID=2742598 RepID=A0A0R1UN06_9LACO|nr:Dipeptidase [Limosilactobacillus equigenerosi DSM 18793 = JCM 14505]